jgi:hypothetical protein
MMISINELEIKHKKDVWDWVVSFLNNQKNQLIRFWSFIWCEREYCSLKFWFDQVRSFKRFWIDIQTNFVLVRVFNVWWCEIHCLEKCIAFIFEFDVCSFLMLNEWKFFHSIILNEFICLKNLFSHCVIQEVWLRFFFCCSYCLKIIVSTFFKNR